MDNPIDLERLSEVFTEHPRLAEAISNGAWWGNCDGTVEAVTPVGDPVAIRAGLVAFVEALGCPPEDIAARGGTPVAVPVGGAVSARRIGR